MSALNFVKKHWKIILVLLYFISPLDLLPEAFLGPLGTIDDVLAIATLIIQYFLEKRRKDVMEGELEND